MNSHTFYLLVDRASLYVLSIKAPDHSDVTGAERDVLHFTFRRGPTLSHGRPWSPRQRGLDEEAT
jgi:hypothetical protein